MDGVVDFYACAALGSSRRLVLMSGENRFEGAGYQWGRAVSARKALPRRASAVLAGITTAADVNYAIRWDAGSPGQLAIGRKSNRENLGGDE